MSEQRSEYAGLCPPWCTSNGDPVEARHTHVSADLVVGAGATARLVRDDDAEPVRVLVGETAISVEEAQAFAHALLRLVADARLAEPGLGFVEHLVTQRGLSTSQLALAASLDVERVRAQRSGAAVLTVREFDQLALAAAQLHCGGDAPVEVTIEHEPVLVVEPAPVVVLVEEPVTEEPEEPEEPEETLARAEVHDVADGAEWADLAELVALAGAAQTAADEAAAVAQAEVEAPAEESAEDDVADDVEDQVEEVEEEVEDRPVAVAERPAVPVFKDPLDLIQAWSVSRAAAADAVELGGGR